MGGHRTRSILSEPYVTISHFLFKSYINCIPTQSAGSIPFTAPCLMYQSNWRGNHDVTTQPNRTGDFEAMSNEAQMFGLSDFF